MSRYLENLVIRNLSGGNRLMPPPRTLYESGQSSSIPRPSDSIRSLENMNGAIDAERLTRDAAVGVNLAIQADKSTPNDVASHQLAGGLATEPGDINTSEAGQPVLEQDRNGIAPQVGSTVTERLFADFPSVDAPQPSLGNQIEPFVQKEVAHLHCAGAGLIEERVPQENLRQESGESFVAMPGRRAEQMTASASVQTHPTLGEMLLYRMRGEGSPSTAMEQPPVVKIHIGRIEVKALHPPTTVPSRKSGEAPRSSLSLDQYLRRRVRET